jgi:hypothetical protein
MRRTLIILLTVGLLTGCATSEPVASPAATSDAPALTADQIVTIDDGIEWARGLDDAATATELSQGIGAIGDLVPGEDIWFQTNNEIGQDLIGLNLDVLNNPEAAGTKVDDLGVIVDKLEAAIAHGDKP